MLAPGFKKPSYATALLLRVGRLSIVGYGLWCLVCMILKLQVKLSVHAMLAYGGSRSVAPFILNVL